MEVGCTLGVQLRELKSNKGANLQLKLSTKPCPLSSPCYSVIHLCRDQDALFLQKETIPQNSDLKYARLQY